MKRTLRPEQPRQIRPLADAVSIVDRSIFKNAESGVPRSCCVRRQIDLTWLSPEIEAV